MNWVYKLFTYTYTYYVQGSEERDTGYALMHVPENASFNNNRSTLMKARHIPDVYEIDLESVKDLTIKF